MTCGHCVSAVRTALEALPGAHDVTVDLDSKQVSVAGVDDWSAIVAAIDDAGFDAVAP
jgi:copper chaperone